MKRPGNLFLYIVLLIGVGGTAFLYTNPDFMETAPTPTTEDKMCDAFKKKVTARAGNVNEVLGSRTNITAVDCDCVQETDTDQQYAITGTVQTARGTYRAAALSGILFGFPVSRAPTLYTENGRLLYTTGELLNMTAAANQTACPL